MLMLSIAAEFVTPLSLNDIHLFKPYACYKIKKVPTPYQCRNSFPRLCMNSGNDVMHPSRSVHRRPYRLVLFDLAAQITVDKGIQIAVHHRADIARFHRCAVILDHAVRVKHIRTDLTAPSDI